jgi:hypothetical protein
MLQIPIIRQHIYNLTQNNNLSNIFFNFF